MNKMEACYLGDWEMSDTSWWTIWVEVINITTGF